MIIGICLACLVVISTPYLVLAFLGLKKKKINLLASATVFSVLTCAVNVAILAVGLYLVSN